jgi:hypothetical protein
MPQDPRPPIDPRTRLPLDQRELDRLVALGHKRDEAIGMMSEAIRRQEEARRGIVDRMR